MQLRSVLIVLVFVTIPHVVAVAGLSPVRSRVSSVKVDQRALMLDVQHKRTKTKKGG